jgi:hypothetical protein
MDFLKTWLANNKVAVVSFVLGLIAGGIIFGMTGR